MNTEDTEIFAKVIANPKTCLMLLDRLKERGCSWSVDHAKLSHKDMSDLAIAVLSEVQRNEQRNK